MFLLKKVYKQSEIDIVSTLSGVGKDISYPYNSGKLTHHCPKICFQQFFSLTIVPNLFLNFPPNSRLMFLQNYSYKKRVQLEYLITFKLAYLPV